MLRDIPRIYLLIFGFVLVIFFLVSWYQENFLRDSDVLQLNEIILTNAVTEVDHTSRLYEGALILADTFESSVWEDLEIHYDEGTEVQFDYLFKDDDRFEIIIDGVETDRSSSPTYILGGDGSDIPRVDFVGHMSGYPVSAVRVKIREPKEAVGDWTYVTTITVDVASDNEAD